jgi:hypothetical protein
MGRLFKTALPLSCLLLGGWVSTVRGDGGIVRFSGRCGGRLVTVFTNPTPLRAGTVDVSILVQDVDSGKVTTDIPIVVCARLSDHRHNEIRIAATTDAAANKLMQAAPFELLQPGKWHLEVFVQDLDREGPIAFDVEVGDAQPEWLSMGLWIGWPLLVVGLFGVHQVLVQRRAATARPFV